MTYKLLTEDTYQELVGIYSKYPALTLNKDGYYYLRLTGLTDEERAAHDRVGEILKKSIKGFKKFNNFKDSKGNPRVRFQYNWNADDPDKGFYFTGVGYLKLDELKPREE